MFYILLVVTNLLGTKMEIFSIFSLRFDLAKMYTIKLKKNRINKFEIACC